MSLDTEELVDLEEHAKAGKKPPEARRYRIRIDREKHIVEGPSITGREILALAGKAPVERFRVDQKLRGGATEKVELDEEVDLRRPGVERFMTLPLDQTEGEVAEAASLVRDFRLPEDDEAHLDARGLPWETVRGGNQAWVIIHDFHVPSGYARTRATLAVLISPGYPDAPLDMCFFHPALQLASGRSIGRTEARQVIRGQVFQRWSRHRTAQNPWRPGVDSLSTHLALVEEWLAREVA